uniref:Uncharacterized protein n=1 Tax=Ditylenchus dipsaci TaxID=166011 RepID=A0A915E062_9BILA
MTILFASNALQTVILAFLLLDLHAGCSIAATTGGSFALPSGLLAKFQLDSVSAHSIVVKMVGGTGAQTILTLTLLNYLSHCIILMLLWSEPERGPQENWK